jgi:chemotaxis protein MotB
MLKRQRKQGQDYHTDETWLIPYADMLTLLLALFIILYAASSIDAQKFEQMVQALQVAFQGEEVTGPSPETGGGEAVPDGEEEVIPPPPDPTEGEREKEMEDLRELQRKINTYIKQNNLQLSLKTELTEGGLIITILDHALFDTGSAEVKPESVKLAKEISNLLIMDPPRHVEIVGHTDNVPIHNEHFRSNWDLSAMRAINFLNIILENEKLDPTYFSFRGHGEYQPVATNDTAAGRQQNRRVEVKILPNTHNKTNPQ